MNQTTSLLAALAVLAGCASAPQRILSVKSQPAEANVCIKGRVGSQLIGPEQQCIGSTPFEADHVQVTDADGKKRVIHFNELNPDKDGFYLVVNRKGYASEATEVPSWNHFLVLKQETPVAVEAPIPVVASGQLAKTGIVKITSEPLGALVYINDTVRGNTPFTYEGQPGMAKLKIEHPDRVAYEGIMSVNSGESRELNIKLTGNAEKLATPVVKSAVPTDSKAKSEDRKAASVDDKVTDAEEIKTPDQSVAVK